MRKFLATAVAALFVFSLFGVAISAEKEKLPSLKGEVVSVDIVAKTLIVKGMNREETFATDEMTKIWTGKQKSGFDDLRVGERVSVRYSPEGDKLLAHRIKIMDEHAANEGLIQTR